MAPKKEKHKKTFPFRQPAATLAGKALDFASLPFGKFALIV